MAGTALRRRLTQVWPLGYQNQPHRGHRPVQTHQRSRRPSWENAISGDTMTDVGPDFDDARDGVDYNPSRTPTKQSTEA